MTIAAASSTNYLHFVSVPLLDSHSAVLRGASLVIKDQADSIVQTTYTDRNGYPVVGPLSLTDTGQIDVWMPAGTYTAHYNGTSDTFVVA